MSTRKVIVQMRYSPELSAAALSAAPVAETKLDLGTVPKIKGVTFDQSFAPTQLPAVTARTAMEVPYVSGTKFDLASDPESSTYIVRAEADEDKIEALLDNEAVIGVYADAEIHPTPWSIICPGSPPLGTDADVERLLCVPYMGRIRMDGSGVLVAIVDTGINQAYLATNGKPINLDVARSWVPSAGMTPGTAPVGHGTMCAFDAAIAAPRATFLDIQLLRSSASGMSGLLSDAIRAYRHLLGVMTAPTRPGENRSLVVSNSWAMFHPSWDFPVGHRGNYSDNPAHPFNQIVSALERVGADILFAAGNCGADCPDDRCNGVTTKTIYGANSHPSVLTIAGVDINKNRVGYSSQGPGRLSKNKPDLCGYTHFQGSGVYPADGGTSAATPVVAGVVAAVRSKRPYSPGNPAASPAAVRALMRLTANDLGTSGFDFDYGFGVVDGCELFWRFRMPFKPIDLCERYPWLCRQLPDLNKILKSPTSEQVEQTPERVGPSDIGALKEADLRELLEAIWQAGYEEGQHSKP